jgi:DNA-binding transcriptional LysR family regulator
MIGELKQVADLALFAKIVQTGGISRCAADLGMERTTISRRLRFLERTLGVKLLDRSPKHMTVTDAGRRCLEQCEQLLASAQNAQSLATIGSIIIDDAPIVVGAPPDIFDHFLEPWLTEFEEENTGLRVERRPVTVWTEEAIESVDIGITLAPVLITSASGWMNTIASVRQSIFASVDYVSSHDPVMSPFDLHSHDCIVESSDSERHSWRFRRNEKITTVTVNSKFVVSSLLEAREATLAGLGISRLPQYLCEPYLRSGRLVDLTPDTESSGRDVVVICPRQRQRKTGTALLRTHLESTFNKKMH